MEYITQQQPTGDLRGRKQKDLPAAAVKFGWASHLQKSERPSPEKKTMQKFNWGKKKKQLLDLKQ